LNELPNEYKYPSYASAAAQSTRTESETQFSSPTASAHTEWQQREQKLEEQIKLQAVQIEQIQADLDAKILHSKELQEKLAQAVELAHSRDVRHDEMLTKFEILMQFLQSTNHPQAQSIVNATSTGIAPTQPTTPDTAANQPTTPDRALPSPPSILKRPNPTASPSRNIYNIFRQQSTKSGARRHPTKRHQSQSQNSASELAQLMDTDEANCQPKPGAKAGPMQE